MWKYSAIALLLGATSCDLAADPEPSADSEDTGADAGEREPQAPALHDVAIATVGSECAREYERACGAHAGLAVLVCSDSRWRAAEDCSQGTRCDTRLGRRQGTCQPIASACEGRAPGEAVCIGGLRQRCDQDLLRNEPDPCPGHAHCNDLDGVACACDSGYAQDGSGGCTNIDDCQGDPCGPPPNSCHDAVGGYSCACGAGYDGTGTLACTNIDDCVGDPCGPPPNSCHDAVGGYSCACGAGFDGTGTLACTENDACETDHGGCDALTTCDSVAGTPVCGACPAGYSGDGVTGCVDVDECTAARRDCDSLASCTNLAGSFACGACPETFVRSDDTECVQLTWSRQFGTAGSDTAYAVATDADGNVYTAGITGPPFDAQHSSVNHILLLKYDGAGQQLWTRELDLTEDDWPHGVTTDASGNVYVSGFGQRDLFLVKYDAAGTWQWTRQVEKTSWGGAAATDSSGNVFVAGSAEEDFDGNTGPGEADALLLKFDASGTRQWTRLLGSSQSDGAISVAIDAADNVYMAGSTNGDLDGSGNAGFRDVFVAKYDAAGEWQWTRQFGSPAQDEATGLTTAATGDVYIAGRTWGRLDPPGSEITGDDADLFVAKYNPAGERLWLRQLGTGVGAVAYGIAAASTGSVYVTGYTDVGLGTGARTGNSGAAFLLKLSPTGQWRWTQEFRPDSTFVNAFGVALDASGGIYVGGLADSAIPGGTHAGELDVLLLKYQ